jgi:hypothetical protein
LNALPSSYRLLSANLLGIGNSFREGEKEKDRSENGDSSSKINPVEDDERIKKSASNHLEKILKDLKIEKSQIYQSLITGH